MISYSTLDDTTPNIYVILKLDGTTIYQSPYEGQYGSTVNSSNYDYDMNKTIDLINANSGQKLEIFYKSDSTVGIDKRFFKLILKKITNTDDYINRVNLQDLYNISTTAPTDGQALVWNDSDNEWKPGTVASSGGATQINDLSDVNTTTTAPTDGQALVWDSANSEWIPGTVASTVITSSDFNYSSASFTGETSKWQNIASISLTPGKWLIMTHFSLYANYSGTSKIRNSICFRENSSEASGSASNLTDVIALQSDIDDRSASFIEKIYNLYTVYTTTTNQTIYLSIEVSSSFTAIVMGNLNLTSGLGGSRVDTQSEFYAIKI
jgi:hypothetical protein